MHKWSDPIFLLSKDKIMFTCNYIKSDHRNLRKNWEDTYGAPVFAWDNSTLVLAAKICTNSDEHCIILGFYGTNIRYIIIIYDHLNNLKTNYNLTV